ncbi:MAG: hypothetical protein CMA31_00205 [Euryarchaeota archaeon]|nr:hypothetical protein [Euryarchaeota archaeon]|tara:strand:+ start:299 stop:658 length:360 start_codon:yes stop_codon:yes gene_type:complete
MRSLIGNKSVIFFMFIAIFFGDYALSQNVLKSIVPRTQIITQNNKNSEQFLEKKFLSKVLVESSIWPKVRISNSGMIDKLSDNVIMALSKSKNKKETRIYIMGNTVPIFKSVVPRTRPL